MAIDGERLGPVALMSKLNTLGGTNDIGRLDDGGEPLRGYEIARRLRDPGGTILRAAIATWRLSPWIVKVLNIRDSLVPRYSQLIYNGFWFSPEMRLLQKTMDETQSTVNGTVRLKLYKGNCIPWAASRPSSTQVLCHLRGGRGLQPGRCHRLHPSQRPAPAHSGPPANK